MKTKDAETLAILALGGWIIWRMIKEPAPATTDEIGIPAKPYKPLSYLAPLETPTDYTQRIRKSYYDDLWNRGELRWQQAANTFWGATEKATEYSDIYPAYTEAYNRAVIQ